MNINSIMKHPQSYVCYRADGPVTIDGNIDKDVWAGIPWTEDFADIEGDRRPMPRFRTRAKMLWDDDYFYVAAEMDEPHVWGTLTEKNAVIYYDPDFEVFIDPDGDNLNYYEFEVNALNTIWELTLPRPYRAGGPAKLGTNLVGLKSAVYIDGTLNDPSDTDKRWCVEMAFPFAALGDYVGKGQTSPPCDGDIWRMAFSRVEWLVDIIHGKYQKVPMDSRPEDNWTWTPQPAIDMHRPWAWGYVQFATGKVGSVELPHDQAWAVKMMLMDIYEAQRLRNLAADNMAELNIKTEGVPGLIGDVLVERTTIGWHAAATVQLADGSTQIWHTREDSRLWTE